MMYLLPCREGRNWSGGYMAKQTEDTISKAGLLKIIKRLLNTRDDLDFLGELERDDLQRLLVALRARIQGSDTPQ